MEMMGNGSSFYDGADYMADEMSLDLFKLNQAESEEATTTIAFSLSDFAILRFSHFDDDRAII